MVLMAFVDVIQSLKTELEGVCVCSIRQNQLMCQQIEMVCEIDLMTLSLVNVTYCTLENFHTKCFAVLSLCSQAHQHFLNVGLFAVKKFHIKLLWLRKTTKSIAAKIF